MTTVDLRRAMEGASGRDLGAFFAYWVHGGRVPVLRTHWDAGRRRARWRVEGARGILDDLPIELRIRQEGAVRIVPLAAGSVELSGEDEPAVEPVGVVMRVED
jgi:aminopeptidase N